MANCSICKVQLDQPGMIETLDCGGDCLQCMGTAGDPAAAKLFLEEIKKLRGALKRALADNAELRENMNSIYKLLTEGDNARLPHRVGCARSIAWTWLRLEDTHETNRPKGY